MSCHLIWLLSIELGSWSCQLWYQHPSWVLTLWTIRDSGFLLQALNNCVGKQNHGGEMMSCHLIWLLSIELGLWSCQLWYQHPLRLLTLWTNLNCLRHLIIVLGNRIMGERWCVAIWFDCSALNWDHGLVNCGTNILCRCWLFGQNEIQVFCLRVFIIIARNRIVGERWCLSIWFDFSALNWDRGVVYQHPSWVFTLFIQNEIHVYCW
jgi:hypothetical protein